MQADLFLKRLLLWPELLIVRKLPYTSSGTPNCRLREAPVPVSQKNFPEIHFAPASYYDFVPLTFFQISFLDNHYWS